MGGESKVTLCSEPSTELRRRIKKNHVTLQVGWCCRFSSLEVEVMPDLNLPIKSSQLLKSLIYVLTL